MGAIHPENTDLSERHIQREGLSMHPAQFFPLVCGFLKQYAIGFHIMHKLLCFYKGFGTQNPS